MSTRKEIEFASIETLLPNSETEHKSSLMLTDKGAKVTGVLLHGSTIVPNAANVAALKTVAAHLETLIKAETTVVVFRVWPKTKGGGVLALFPHEPGNSNPGNCLSYEHVGQHGGADYGHCIQATRPAKPAEYAALKRELESIGYTLAVRTRARCTANLK